MELFKTVFFRTSCLLEGSVLFYFVSNNMYEIPAFIVVKWVLTLFFFSIEYLIVKHKEKLNADGSREYEP